jgi:hypothetical protein
MLSLTKQANVMGDSAQLLFVLFLVTSDEVCVERCLTRGATGGTVLFPL